MKKIILIFLVFLFVYGCGKKSEPAYKSEYQIKKIIIS